MIPIIDLKAQYSSIREEIQQAIDGVLNSSQFILGEEVQKFEEEFSTYVGGEFGVAVNSGTSALHLSLLAADIGPGDEVITPGFSYIATAETIALLGAKPVYVDIDPKTYNLDQTKLEAAITSKTRY